MLTLLIGTDRIANTDRLFEMLAKDVAEEKGNRILMVPELISHDSERRLCSLAGDTASRFAEVLSFSRLARRVSDSCGHAAFECMDNGGRIVAMAAATRQLHSRLKAYAAVETKPEFLEGLLDAIDEFKRCCISPTDLKSASERTEGSLAQKLEELALIFESYDAICARGKRDPRDQMTWLLEELECGHFANEHCFYIDGFPDFTRQHFAIVVHLIKESENVVISLNCDCPNSDLIAFEKVGETAGELLNAAKRHGIETNIINVSARQDVLAAMRNRIFQGKIDNVLPDNSLRLICACSQHNESLAAAERVIELVHKGARYRDISLIYTDPAQVNTLEMVFERCHIPAYFSGTEPILGKSVIATVLCAMETALGGFEKQDVIRYLKSPLSPLEMDLCDNVENYATLWNITGKGWLQQWVYHPGGLGVEWDENSLNQLQILDNARRIAVEPLRKLWESFRAATDISEQVMALYRFFSDIKLDSRLNALAKDFGSAGDNRNAQILSQLWDILIGALEQLYDVLGGTAWDCETFHRLFRLLLSCYDVGTIPTVLDAVTVGPVSAMRCQRAKHLILIGALEGNLPGYAGSTGVLNDNERMILRNMGVPLTGGAMDGLKAEFAEIFGVFSGALESVTVSYPGGQPSFVYRRLREMVTSEQVTGELLGPALSDRMEAGAYCLRYHDENAALAAGLSEEYHTVLKSAHHHLGAVSQSNVHSLYGNRMMLSASQVDKLADCRFHYFMRYGIRAKELKPATVDPAEFGTYVHAVLENSVREICDLGGFCNVTLEQTLEIAQKYSREYALQRFSQLDTERINYIFNRNTHELVLIVQELWEELRNSKFEPVGFEVSFGEDGQMPAVDCSGNLIGAQLGGFVDRVDRWVNGNECYFRVVDYKTGKKSFDYCDVLNGLGLQMLLYMFALEESGIDLLGDKAVPAGVQYFPARVPYLGAEGQLSDEEASSLRKSSWKRSGLVLDNDDVLDAMGPADSAFRFSYKRKKDGSVTGDIAKSQQFELLRKYVFNLLKDLVDDVASGNVEPNPYTRGSSHNACSFCPYGSVCHKTTVENRRDYRAVTADEFWNYVQQEVSNRG